ncbi:MAG: hypothetical protein QM698_15460 [Micropepsaceae bacterium]
MIRALAFVLITPLLAACGGLEAATGMPDPFGTPQPFRGTGNWELVGDVMGERPVYIGAITGLTPEAELDLRKQIATNAAALDVMASAETVPHGSLTLTGASRAAAADFLLTDGDQKLATFTSEGDPGLLAVTAARQLAEVLGRLGAPPPTPPATADATANPGAPPARQRPAQRAPLIHIGKITTPEAGQAEPLRRAIARRLGEMGAKIAETPSGGAYLVTATLGFSASVDGRTSVSIIWRVSAPDGSDLGQAAQDNTLPTDAVKTTWAEQATLAGNAAALSVAKLVAGHFNRGS